MAFDSMDHIRTPAIEQAVPTSASSTEEIVDRVNAGLPAGVRVELPKTREEKECAVHELVVRSLQPGEYEQGFTVRYIRDDVYSMRSGKTGNITAYVNERGETLFWVKPLKDRRYVANGKVFSDLGLVEKKVGTRYDMYRIVGYITNGAQNEPLLEWPIDQESEDGYEMWRDVMFHADVIGNLLLLKTPVEVDEKWLRFRIEDGSFRFQDLEAFLAKKKIIPTEELARYAIEELRKILPRQCNPWDPIFRRLESYGDPYTIRDSRETRSMGIRESDLKYYLDRWYIDVKLAEGCYSLLPIEKRDLSGGE